MRNGDFDFFSHFFGKEEETRDANKKDGDKEEIV